MTSSGPLSRGRCKTSGWCGAMTPRRFFPQNTIDGFDGTVMKVIFTVAGAPAGAALAEGRAPASAGGAAGMDGSQPQRNMATASSAAAGPNGARADVAARLILRPLRPPSPPAPRG